MSKEETEQIHSHWIKAENGKITHYYRATKSIIESEVKLLEPDNLEVKKLEDKVIELVKKLAKLIMILNFTMAGIQNNSLYFGEK
jgi:hypothetical protein